MTTPIVAWFAGVLALAACRTTAPEQPSQESQQPESSSDVDRGANVSSPHHTRLSPHLTHCVSSFISAMHRPIHAAWSHSFLKRLDALPAGDPLSDSGLWTRVEVSLKPDGTIASVTTVRPSGSKVFDAAARDAMLTAGPFPGSPASMVSGDGNTYLHWAFHRDERACGTFGATPFVLDLPDTRVTPRARVMVTDATSRTADEWLHYVHLADIDNAVALSDVPFSIGGEPVANTSDELATALRDVSRSMTARPKRAKILSPGELCHALGGLPRGVAESTDLALALTKVGGDHLVLLLRGSANVWRVRGTALLATPAHHLAEARVFAESGESSP